jgi:hypothetical protein
MTVTYTNDTLDNGSVGDDVFVPRYARSGKARKKGGVRTWMILAPVGALALLGGAALVWMSGETGEGSLVSESTPAPVAQPAVQPTVPLESSTASAALNTGLPSNATISETTPAAPVARQADPSPVVVQRRASPAPRRAAPVEAAPVAEEAPAQPTGPQPYTATLNSQPSAEVTRAPAIVPAPLN